MNTQIISNKILTKIEYSLISAHKTVKLKQFLETKAVFNNKTGEIININFDEEWHFRQNYLYNTFRIDYLNKECIDNNMIPIFLTLTLPSEYHPSSKKFDSSNTVENGYKKLNSMFRSIYKDFKIDRKFVKGLKFIRVIEPHKSFVPHLHALVYVHKEHKEPFIKHLNNIIKFNKLKQTDIKVLDSEKYASVYLLKYVEKTLKNDAILGGWRTHHKINRVISMSNLNNGIDRETFKVLSRVVSFDNQSNLNYFEQILSKCSIKKTLVDEDNNILKCRNYGVSNSSYSVVVVRQKFYKFDNYYDDDGELSCDDDEYTLKDVASYKTLSLKMFSFDNILLHDKSWFELIDKHLELSEPHFPNKNDTFTITSDNYIEEVEITDLYGWLESEKIKELNE